MATIQHTDIAYPPADLAISKAIELAGAAGIYKHASLGVFRGDHLFHATNSLELEIISQTGNTSPLFEVVAYDAFDVTEYGQFRKGYSQNNQTCMNLVRDLTIATADSFDWNITVVQADIAASAASHADGYFDFVWLDLPDKSQASMDAVLSAWVPKVRSGGIIGGVQYTDSIIYANSTVACGIKASVDAQVATQSTDLHVFTNAGKQWLFTKA